MRIGADLSMRKRPIVLVQTVFVSIADEGASACG